MEECAIDVWNHRRRLWPTSEMLAFQETLLVQVQSISQYSDSTSHRRLPNHVREDVDVIVRDSLASRSRDLPGSMHSAVALQPET